MYVPGALKTLEYQILVVLYSSLTPVTFVMKTQAGCPRKMHTSIQFRVSFH